MRPAPYPYILSTCPWNRTTHLLVISEAYSPIYLAGKVLPLGLEPRRRLRAAD